MSKLVHIRLPERLLLESESIVEEGGYSTLSEFIKGAMREAIDSHSRRKALRLLAKNFGRGKGRSKPLTEREKAEAAEELFNSGESDILRKP